MEMESVIFQMQFVLEKIKTKKYAMNCPLIYAPSRFFSLLRTFFFLGCFSQQRVVAQLEFPHQGQFGHRWVDQVIGLETGKILLMAFPEIRQNSPGEVGSFSHYLPGFIYATGGWPWDFWSINSMTWLVTLNVELDLGLSLGAAGDGVCNPVIHN